MPAISVIVPVYNTAKHLPHCLDSILAQTFEDLEVILLDDGSDDNSYEIMRQYAQKDKRIRTVKLEHQGIANVRKKGVDLAKGPYIGFADSDDWVEPTMYGRLYTAIKKNNCDLVSSDVFFHYISGDKTIICDNYKRGLYTNLCEEIFPTMLHNFSEDAKGLRCWLWSKLFCADKLKGVVKSIDTRVFYSEDAMILYRYCLKCKSIYIMREPFYHYNIDLGSAERHPKANEPDNMYWLFTNLKQAFENSPYAEILLPQLYQYAILLNMRVLRGLYGMDFGQIAEWVFCGYEKIYGKRTVVYGAGVCGRAFCKDLWKQSRADHVIAWVDKNPEQVANWDQRYMKVFENTPLAQVQPVSALGTLDFDYVAVAIKKESVAREVIKELQEIWNIPREKIVWGSSCKKNLASMLCAAYM